MLPLAKNAPMAALIQRYVDLAVPLMAKPSGSIATGITRLMNSAGESALGDVVGDLYLAGAGDPAYGTDAGQLAMANPGGIRADLPTSGPVSYGQLLAIMPFGNNLVTQTMSGAQVLRALEQQWESPQPAGGRTLQISSSLSYAWDANQPALAAPGKGNRVLPGSLELNGVVIEYAKNYRVTINNFLQTGGATTLPSFAKARVPRPACSTSMPPCVTCGASRI